MNEMVKKMMQIILFLAVGTISLEVCGVDFVEMNVTKNEKNASYAMRDSNRKNIGTVIVYPKSDFAKLNVSAEPDAIVIDTRELFKDVSGKAPLAVFRFTKIDQSGIVRESENGKTDAETSRLRIELQSDSPTDTKLYFEGHAEKDGSLKHYWTAEEITLNGKPQTVSIDKIFPANLKRIYVIRLDLRSACQLKIRKIVFEKVPLTKGK